MDFHFEENSENKSITSKTKAEKIIYHDEKNMFIVPNHKNNVDYDENPSLSHLMDRRYSKENYGNESFSRKTKASK